MSDNLFRALRSAFPDDLARIAIEVPGGRQVSYDQLIKATGRMANALRTAGARPGDRIAVQVNKSVDAVLLYLATLRLGAVFLPLNTGYTLAELGYFLGDAAPSVMVCRPEMERDLTRTMAGIGGGRLLMLGEQGEGSLLELAAKSPTRFEDEPRTRADLASIIYTSGTTGRSKGAMLSIGNLLSNAETLRDAWRFDSSDVLLHALPIFHVHGLFVALNVPLLSGARLLFLDRFDAGEVVRLLPRSTVFMGVPTFYTRLLSAPDFGRETCRQMRLFVSGSAPLLAETHRAFEERTGLAILERYGMSETGMLTSNPYDGQRIAGTVGPPLPDVSLRIAAPDGGLQPDGEIGEIEVAGPNVFAGYWQQPEKSRAAFTADGFFKTGDLGLRDAQGYVHIIGRAKDLIISGGYNVYPREVEAAIDELPEVVESAVIGLPHPDLGEAVAAVVVLAPGASLDLAALSHALEDKLARFKQPRRLFTVKALPRNSMGKVQKAALRITYKDAFA